MSSNHKALKTDLKRNELAIAIEKAFAFVKVNAAVFWALALAVIALGVTLLGLKIYHQVQVNRFNEKWHAVNESLLKEQNLKELIADYPALPAHNLAVFALAEYQLENQKHAEALATLATGLQDQQANILTTVLVLKSVAIYKSQKQFAEAASFLEAQKNQVLPSYLPQANLLKGDLYLLAGDVSKARAVYSELATPALKPDAATEARDVQINKLAKEKLLQLELNTK